MMIHSLINGGEVVVSAVCHDEEFASSAPQEELCDHFALNFIASGEFDVLSGRSRSRVRGGDALVCRPGSVRTYVHREDVPADTCISVEFRGAIAGEAVRSCDDGQAESEEKQPEKHS